MPRPGQPQDEPTTHVGDAEDSARVSPDRVAAYKAMVRRRGPLTAQLSDEDRAELKRLESGLVVGIEPSDP